MRPLARPGPAQASLFAIRSWCSFTKDCWRRCGDGGVCRSRTLRAQQKGIDNESDSVRGGAKAMGFQRTETAVDGEMLNVCFNGAKLTRRFDAQDAWSGQDLIVCKRNLIRRRAAGLPARATSRWLGCGANALGRLDLSGLWAGRSDASARHLSANLLGTWGLGGSANRLAHPRTESRI